MVSIGFVSQVYGCSKTSLRRWERLGILGEVPRTATGRRNYNAETLNTLKIYLWNKWNKRKENKLATTEY